MTLLSLATDVNACVPSHLYGLRLEHRRRNMWENHFKQRLNGDRLVAREGCEPGCINPDHQVRAAVVVERRS